MGTTILLTTHYLEEAEELCDEIAIINHGKVIAYDRKENLMNLMKNKELIVTADDVSLVKELFNDLDVKILAGNKFSITYDSGKIAVDKIIRTIVNNNIQVKDISTNQPDLEEIFKHLVGKY